MRVSYRAVYHHFNSLISLQYPLYYTIRGPSTTVKCFINDKMMIGKGFVQLRHKSIGPKRNEILKALNLFSSKEYKNPNKSSNKTDHSQNIQTQNIIKPSILASFAYGPPLERLRTNQSPKLSAKSEIHMNELDELINVLSIVSSPKQQFNRYEKLIQLSESEFKRSISSISDETFLIEMIKFLYYQGKLTLNRFTIIVLNKHLKKLDLLPFKINNLAESSLKWSQQDYVKFNITLLRKYYKLHRPLNIVKNLKTHFSSSYLPAIKSNSIPRFHQRIVWKFYFDYVRDLHDFKGEEFFISDLNDIRHSFTIWESCSYNFDTIIKAILNVHGDDLNRLSKTFFKLCSVQGVQDLIRSELTDTQGSYSETLTHLKGISITYKLHTLGLLDESLLETRAVYYKVIDALEKFIDTLAIPEKDMATMRTELSMMKQSVMARKEDDILTWGNWVLNLK